MLRGPHQPNRYVYFLMRGESPAAVNWPLRPFMSRHVLALVLSGALASSRCLLVYSVHSGVFDDSMSYEPSCPA